MKKNQNQHVTPHKNGGWQVKGVGNSSASKHTKTQAEAISTAKNIANNKNSELLVHNQHGEIRRKTSYGNDPHPPKG